MNGKKHADNMVLSVGIGELDMKRQTINMVHLAALSLLTGLCASSSPAFSQPNIDPTSSWTAPVKSKDAPAASPDTGAQTYTAKLPCKCAAMLPPGVQPPTDPKKKKHKVLAGLKHELGMEMGDLGKDMFLAFSVSGKDPYEMPAHPDIPYVWAEAQFIDGTSSHVYKYPDNSWRMQGGFLDGTYACAQADGSFLIQYPNGAQGKMKMFDNGAEIWRPDQTITTVTKTGDNAYRVVNSKIGYMGDITPDTTGLSYEFAKQDF